MTAAVGGAERSTTATPTATPPTTPAATLTATLTATPTVTPTATPTATPTTPVRPRPAVPTTTATDPPATRPRGTPVDPTPAAGRRLTARPSALQQAAAGVSRAGGALSRASGSLHEGPSRLARAELERCALPDAARLLGLPSGLPAQLAATLAELAAVSGEVAGLGALLARAADDLASADGAAVPSPRAPRPGTAPPPAGRLPVPAQPAPGPPGTADTAAAGLGTGARLGDTALAALLGLAGTTAPAAAAARQDGGREPWPSVRRRAWWQAPVDDADLVVTLGLEGLVAGVPPPVMRLVGPVGARVPDGPGWATPLGPPRAERTSPATPAAWLRAVDAAQADPGRLTVTRLAGGRWVVALPGIHAMLPAPDPQDLPGAVHAVATRHGGYAGAVVAALGQAGVPAGASLLLVGHSQGGIVAADLAADPAVAARWRITHVLAAGSPVAGVPVRPGEHLLTLDNADDLVPALDRRRAALAPGRVGVRFAEEVGSVGGNHSLAGVYAPYADSPAFARAPGVAAWEAGAAPYLTGGPATVQTFALRDRPP